MVNLAKQSGGFRRVRQQLKKRTTMDNYIDFQRFSSIEQTSDLISILDKNDIPYQIDDSALRFQLVCSINSQFNQVILKIRDKDFEKVNNLIFEKSENIDDSHYLFTFSDKDIIDVIANPNDWTNDEQTIAKQIINKRGLSVTAEDIRQARIKNAEINKDSSKDKPVSKGYGWFLTIGLLSILNTIIIANKTNFHFVFGLGYSQVIDGMFYSLLGGFKLLGILISSLVSGIFIVIWYFAKANRNWAYITGLILYGLDVLIFIYCKDWLSTGFHLFA